MSATGDSVFHVEPWIAWLAMGSVAAGLFVASYLTVSLFARSRKGPK